MMSKEASSSSRLISRNSQPEPDENEFGASTNSLNIPPPRTPLNAIPDPSQYQKETQESEVNKTNRWSSPSEKRVLEASGSVGQTHGTSRVSARQGKFHSEPSSVQSSPARSGGGSRVSLGGGRGVSCYSSSFSRVSRGTSVVNPEFSVEVPQFELVEDPLFWEDYNVQVLIRIRPLSTIERVSQGYARCLRQESSQTLLWLGQLGHPETRFTFDHVACEMITQEKLFGVAGLPMVENCLSGYNSCMFAYGQTGSGKTYTMMGEINGVEGELNEDCGITPRIFEYLFSRIKAEEESRRDERLKFSCKCSFLEIYNEQITDLLEPSSTNLQLREDLKKGVYVENLTEYNVTTVNDVVKLLLQGAANRKMAATYMNSESSRSHSVFTCIIESQWEKDSMTHFRFARLNLVDLAGSERQKSSGADGDRLKEAANINKSLSTLGLVIMSLVDLAHGKHRHVPYRDSRLTFLLQDSLGGNSKTTIIANVSPSIRSANETLSTLKFAQRAKLIQNNAKVNENASGDITALQRQIQQLKGQLSSLMKHHNLSRLPSNGGPRFEESRQGDIFKRYSLPGGGTMDNKLQNFQNEKIKRMELMLMGSLRREKTAEAALQKSEAEIEHQNRLACQREEDAQRIKMMLKFREEKIKQLELLVNGCLSTEKYLSEENKALKEEIQLLQGRIDRNPELTRFALENIRLLEQLQLFQSFYEQGERETLLAEVAQLRDQLMDIIEGKDKLSSRYEHQDDDTVKELEDCRNMNSKLMREVDELRTELRNYMNDGQAIVRSVADSPSKDHEVFRQTDEHSMVETISIRSDYGDEVASYSQADDMTLQNKNDQNMTSNLVSHPGDTQKELMDARLLIEALEHEQVRLFQELQLMQEQNHGYMKISNNKDNADGQSELKLENHCLESGDLERQNKGLVKAISEGIDRTSLQGKLDKLTKDLEEARLLNCHYQEDQASQLSRQHQVDLVREEVEIETSRTILHLQEEVSALQLELHEGFGYMTQQNTSLRNTISAKEEEIRKLGMEWEKATLELTNFLVDGSRSLKAASRQIESIACSFPQVNAEIGENVERAARACIEKEETIQLLQQSLEDAQKMVLEMEEKLTSLKGATIALNEFQQPDEEKGTEETIHLNMELKEKINMVKVLETNLKLKEDQNIKAEKRADAAFLVVKWLYDSEKVVLNDDIKKDFLVSKLAGYMVNSKIFMMDTEQIAVKAKDIKVQSFKEQRSLMLENQSHIMQQLKDELAATNDRLDIIADHINKASSVHVCPTKDEDLIDADGWSADCSTSSSGYSTESFASENNLDRSSSTYFAKFHPYTTEDIVNLEFKGGSAPLFATEDSKKLKTLLTKSGDDEAMTFSLRKELEMVSDAFNKLYLRFTVLLDDNDIVDYPFSEGMKQGVPSLGLTMERNEAGCTGTTEADSNEKINHSSCFSSKFEEARETMKEADFMLNALLKANENSKQLNGMWKQASEQLMAERSSLLEEIEQLKSSLHLKEAENESLQDHIQSGMLEIVNSMSLLQGCFLQVQKEVEDRFKELYSDVLSMGGEMCNFICNSRSLMEDNISEIIRKEFELFVLYFCHVREIISTVPCAVKSSFHPIRQQECHSITNTSQKVCMNGQDDILITYKKGAEEVDKSELVRNMEDEELCESESNLLYENWSLKRELERKEVLLQGLLFDFSLLQESASNKKDIKDETEKLYSALNQLRHELHMKTSQLDDLLLQHKKLETNLADTENALLISGSDLELAKESIDALYDQNAELRVLLKDIYLKNSAAEDQLEEQKEVVKGLEKEILHLTSVDEKLLSSVESVEEDLRKVTAERDKLHEEIESIEEDLRKVTSERDNLYEEVCSLNSMLEMTYALADEKEAVAVEARLESEASKSFAEQKEEEVKILENSIEELECTINVLEKKVYEMDEEVERHRLIRNSLELELQAFRERLSTVENFPDIVDSENTTAEHSEGQMSRLLQLQEAQNRIRLLEREREEQDKEIKQCKEYISEVVLHSEAQSSQYQHKISCVFIHHEIRLTSKPFEQYKTLEAMILEIKTNLSNPTSTAAASDKIEKSSARSRGSSSPFRCISSVVQQMNLEKKDQELSTARHRIEELEALAATRQKEVCTLNARLAAAESMTHDVIRDLLGVKLDMTNYANLIDQQNVQKLVVAAHQQTEEFLAKEQIILNLRKQIDNVVEERDSCISEMKRKEADMLAAQVTAEELQERDQLLSAQNEILKMDKTNLLRRITELDDMVKTLLGTQSTPEHIQQTSKIKAFFVIRQENHLQKPGDAADFSRRQEHSVKLLSRVNGELAQYRKSSGSRLHDRNYLHGLETNYSDRKPKA
ncbi:hypothetical protein EZV62_000043 [Acer yangbiense]|uniref:Kinesin motor domain-containing protein n=1 Tax=Acer yangbiense TaxID=1000413 RepID=A0A5C7IRL2_9ROSI|nr:hypothetical protein EZV62_000043 [Acer yangbiense]